MKLYLISDIHLVAPGALSKGLDTSERLQWALDDLATHHADADYCLLLGDLADHGEEEAYRALRRQLANVSVPLLITLGNHDDRATFRQVFDDLADDGAGFFQRAVDTPHGVLLLLDSAETGYASGKYDEARLAWLARELAKAKDRPVYVFLHHPPFDIGTRVDGIKLMDHAPFGDLLAAHGDVRHIVAGHTHRVCSGVWRGIPFTNLGASTYNVDLFQRHLPGHGRRFADPVMTGVMLFSEEGIVVHACDVSPYRAPMAPQLFPEKRVEEIIARGGKLAAE